MQYPDLMERVRLVGFDEVYVVACINYETQVADLLPILNGGQRLRAVPFTSMEEVPVKWPAPLRSPAPGRI
jgi:hypothetical protein